MDAYNTMLHVAAQAPFPKFAANGRVTLDESGAKLWCISKVRDETTRGDGVDMVPWAWSSNPGHGRYRHPAFPTGSGLAAYVGAYPGAGQEDGVSRGRRVGEESLDAAAPVR